MLSSRLSGRVTAEPRRAGVRRWGTGTVSRTGPMLSTSVPLPALPLRECSSEAAEHASASGTSPGIFSKRLHLPTLPKHVLPRPGSGISTCNYVSLSWSWRSMVIFRTFFFFFFNYRRDIQSQHIIWGKKSESIKIPNSLNLSIASIHILVCFLPELFHMGRTTLHLYSLRTLLFVFLLNILSLNYYIHSFLL